MREHFRVPLIILTLLLVAIVTVAMFQVRSELGALGTFFVWLIGGFGVLLLGAGVVLLHALWKHFNRPHVIHHGPYGTTVIHRGNTIQLEPMGNPTGDQVQLIQPPANLPMLEAGWDTQEPESDGDTSVLDDELPEELTIARDLYNKGNHGRDKLSEAMKATGSNVSPHKAAKLLLILRERGLIDV